MRIRRAREADVAAMAGIAAASYRDAFAAILEPAALATRGAGFFAGRFADAWPDMRVATEGEGGVERVVGFALTTRGHIDMLFVAPDATGRGAGGALLAQLEAEGARTLECFRDNARARAFYEKRGWRAREEYAREFAGRPRDFVLYARGPARDEPQRR